MNVDALLRQSLKILPEKTQQRVKVRYDRLTELVMMDAEGQMAFLLLLCDYHNGKLSAEQTEINFEKFARDVLDQLDEDAE